MLRVPALIILVQLCCIQVYAQERDVIEDIMTFLGVDSPQDLDEDEVERLSEFHSTPVKMNQASETALRATGLFSQYQLAVISDYKSRHGLILSLTELSYLDGFDESFVRKLSPFISLETRGPSVGPMHASLRNDLHVRAGYKLKEQNHFASYALKYRMKSEHRYHFSLSFSRPYEAEPWYPSAFSSTFQWRFKADRGGLTIGDFNARFGQGLTLWNNAFMTALTSPDSFMKKSSGISPVWSYTGAAALTGAASDIRIGRWTIWTMVAFPGIKSIGVSPEKLTVMPALNLSWYGRYGHVAVTGVATFPVRPSCFEKAVRTSTDYAFCIHGINLFGELSYCWSESGVRAVTGARFRTGERHDMAALLRYLHGESWTFAASGALNASEMRHGGTWSIEASYYPISKDKDKTYSAQLKSVLAYNMHLSTRFQMKVRLSERFRTWDRPFRTDVRADLAYDHGEFAANLRLNVVSCSQVACLAYVEGEYERDRFSFHLRQGVFCVDEWDDRIYVYEHDLPGSFNAPAMYGRGFWTSAVVRASLTEDMRLYLRASYTGYPFMPDEKKKPGKAELKLQMQYRF